VGYGFVFVAAQGFVLSNTSIANRARGFSLFVGAIMVATVCGPSIGGILADNIGERLTFGISAMLAVISILAIQMMPEDRKSDEQIATLKRPTLAQIGSLLINQRFMTLTGLAAIPAKILLTGVCFYLVPLYIVAVGSSQAMAGRILMTYAVMMVLMAPVATALAKTREHREWLVGTGLLVSGLGASLMLFEGSVGWVFAAVCLIGLGQSLSITAQSALVSEHCDQEIARMGDQAVYGVYRLLERLGNASGPLLAGALVMLAGYQRSFVVIGLLTLACGAVFLITTRWSRPRPALAPVG
jgi:predicted MFS family arabinose efflux permease